MGRRTIKQQKALNDHYQVFKNNGVLEYSKVFGYWKLAVYYKEAGFSPEDAKVWSDHCRDLMSPKEMAEWRAAGFTPDEAAKWAINWTLQAAQERRSSGKSSRKQVSKSSTTR